MAAPTATTTPCADWISAHNSVARPKTAHRRQIDADPTPNSDQQKSRFFFSLAFSMHFADAGQGYGGNYELELLFLGCTLAASDSRIISAPTT